MTPGLFATSPRCCPLRSRGRGWLAGFLSEFNHPRDPDRIEKRPVVADDQQGALIGAEAGFERIEIEMAGRFVKIRFGPMISRLKAEMTSRPAL
jgi:hypothetical protein